jgi:hypothetical protein
MADSSLELEAVKRSEGMNALGANEFHTIRN